MTEAGTGEPIGGAQVSAFGTITTTDPSGFYALTNVPAGLAKSSAYAKKMAAMDSNPERFHRAGSAGGPQAVFAGSAKTPNL